MLTDQIFLVSDRKVWSLSRATDQRIDYHMVGGRLQPLDCLFQAQIHQIWHGNGRLGCNRRLAGNRRERVLKGFRYHKPRVLMIIHTAHHIVAHDLVHIRTESLKDIALDVILRPDVPARTRDQLPLTARGDRLDLAVTQEHALDIAQRQLVGSQARCHVPIRIDRVEMHVDAFLSRLTNGIAPVDGGLIVDPHPLRIGQSLLVVIQELRTVLVKWDAPKVSAMVVAHDRIAVFRGEKSI